MVVSLILMSLASILDKYQKLGLLVVINVAAVTLFSVLSIYSNIFMRLPHETVFFILYVTNSVFASVALPFSNVLPLMILTLTRIKEIYHKNVGL